MNELLDMVWTEHQFIELSDPCKKYYYASPYSHDDPDVVAARYRTVFASTARLMQAGFHVFSPIVYSHPLAQLGGLGSDWEFWAEFDQRELSIRDVLLVHLQDGWDRSVGVLAEIEWARSLGLPVIGIVCEVNNEA